MLTECKVTLTYVLDKMKIKRRASLLELVMEETRTVKNEKIVVVKGFSS